MPELLFIRALVAFLSLVYQQKRYNHYFNVNSYHVTSGGSKFPYNFQGKIDADKIDLKDERSRIIQSEEVIQTSKGWVIKLVYRFNSDVKVKFFIPHDTRYIEGMHSDKYEFRAELESGNYCKFTYDQAENNFRDQTFFVDLP